jgi:hypothetical protein
MLTKKIISFLILALLTVFNQLQASQVVIVHSSSTLDISSIKKILLAKNDNARLYFLMDKRKREQFTRKYSGKSANSIQRKWQRLVFSGRAKPPVIVDSLNNIIKAIANDPKGIGHIDMDSYEQQPGIKTISP